MGRKTPMSFNSRKYVEKHCNGSQWVHSKTQKQGELQHRLYCSWFDWLFLEMIEKQSKRRLKIEIFIFVKSIALTKNWFAVSNFW